VILRCNSAGDLYPVRVSPSATSLHAADAISVDVWHQRLGHPGRTTLARTLRQIAPSSVAVPAHTCHACQVGKNVRLPFPDSSHVSYFPFQLVHFDIWT
jgi:hypothetical protein